MQADYTSLGNRQPTKDVSFHLLQKATRRLQKTKGNDIRHAHHFIGTGAVTKEDPQQLHGPGWAEKFHHPHPPHSKLGQYASTAICGNDIASSCLYMTGLCVSDAGVYCAIPLLLVAFTLYCFRFIYGEAVSGLPLNGGAYNILLNTTSKSTAALAAVLTILSYIATGVVSASSAIAYLLNLWPELNMEIGVLVLLALFAFLNILGVAESARVALFLFVVHICCLFILLITGLVIIFSDLKVANDIFMDNWNSPLQPSLAPAIFFGFSSAMLGVSGFETSANFVEEQKPGVFVKTLRNMWAVSSFFNPLLGTLVVLVCRLEDVRLHSGDALGFLATALTGQTGWLTRLVSLDAFMVLSGAVLTSYVGVTGLCSRLAGDQCLPQFLLYENSCRRTKHRIIISFFIACSLMYIVLNGNVEDLSSVYSIAFMSVMILFAISTAMLKYKRANLAREVRSSWLGLVAAVLLTGSSIVATLIKETRVVAVFSAYFFVTAAFMASMFFRLPLLNIIFSMTLETVGYWCPSWVPNLHANEDELTTRKQTIVLTPEATTPGSVQFMNSASSSMILDNAEEDDSGPDVSSACCCLGFLVKQILTIGRDTPVLFFCKRGTISVMNRAILYIRKNEDARHVRIVHCYTNETDIPDDLETSLRALDACYPKMKIDLILVKAPFGPAVISYLATTLHTPQNLMFITCPGANFTHKIGDLGGVRLITH